MRTSEARSDLYRKLQGLSVEDPGAARLLVVQLMDTNPAALDPVLELACRPGEGRIRQLIATAVRNRGDKAKLIPVLLRWLGNETDEFARRSIQSALANVDLDARVVADERGIFDSAFVNAYRYAASRLKHECRNALLGPSACIVRLKTKVASIADVDLRAQLSSLIGQLDDTFTRFGEIVDFEPRDDFFEFRTVELYSWITSMNVEYAKQYSPISLIFNLDPSSHSATVRASNYLLRIVFWNLWMNAHQALPSDCKITVSAALVANHVELLILDNGGGFSQSVRDIAFRVQYSGAGNRTRGRGLLEIQDAVEQLQGSVQLLELTPNQYRIKIRLPLAKT